MFLFYLMILGADILWMERSDFAFCVFEAGYLIYFAGFARVTYYTLLADARRWRQFFAIHIARTYIVTRPFIPWV
jgi:hypothetical protein